MGCRYRVYANGHIVMAQKKCHFCQYAKHTSCTYYVNCSKNKGNKNIAGHDLCDEFKFNKNLLEIEYALEDAFNRCEKPRITINKKEYGLQRLF